MTGVIPLHPEASLSLALAVIESSSAPIVLLDGNLCVIAASTSFYQAFLIDPKTAAAKQFSQLGGGEWNVARYRSCWRQRRPESRMCMVTRWI